MDTKKKKRYFISPKFQDLGNVWHALSNILPKCIILFTLAAEENLKILSVVMCNKSSLKLQTYL